MEYINKETFYVTCKRGGGVLAISVAENEESGGYNAPLNPSLY